MPRIDREAITAGTDIVELPVHRTDGTPPLFAGLRQSWIQATDDESGVEIDMDAGAGVGSPYLTLRYEFPDGAVIHEYVDMAAFFRARATAVIAAHKRTER